MVYVIYDKEGWEICGIDKCYAKRSDAETYVLKTFKEAHSGNLDSFIEEIEVI